jgi:hypothetical protein
MVTIIRAALPHKVRTGSPAVDIVPERRRRPDLTGGAENNGAAAGGGLHWRRRSQPTPRALPLPRQPLRPGGRASPTDGRVFQKLDRAGVGATGSRLQRQCRIRLRRVIGGWWRVRRRRRRLHVPGGVAGGRGRPVSDGREARSVGAGWEVGRDGVRFSAVRVARTFVVCRTDVRRSTIGAVFLDGLSSYNRVQRQTLRYTPSNGSIG